LDQFPEVVKGAQLRGFKVLNRRKWFFQPGSIAHVFFSLPPLRVLNSWVKPQGGFREKRKALFPILEGGSFVWENPGP